MPCESLKAPLVRTTNNPPTTAAGSDTALEIEPIDVALIENKRRAETYFIIGYFNLAQPSGGEFTIASFQLSLAQCIRRINRQVPEIDRIPKHDALNHACLH